MLREDEKLVSSDEWKRTRSVNETRSSEDNETENN